MDKIDSIKTIDFILLFSWDEVQTQLKLEPNLRLPDIGEAIMMDYTQQAIWISDTINDKNCVMDIHWGIQVVRSGKYGLILVEK